MLLAERPVILIPLNRHGEPANHRAGVTCQDGIMLGEMFMGHQ